jgi:hypothetical protein
MIFLLVAAAWADTIELDNGVAFLGHITRWSDDACAAVLDAGPLEGLTVEIPCERIAGFERGDPQERSQLSPPPPPATPHLALAAVVPDPGPAPMAPAEVPLAIPQPAALPPPAPAPAPAPAPVVAAPSPAPAVAPPSPAPPAAESQAPPAPPEKQGWKGALQAEWVGVKSDLGLAKKQDDGDETSR